MNLKENLFWERFRPNTLNLVDNDLVLNYIFHGQGGQGKCVNGDTLIKVRNKTTGEIKEIKMKELL